MDIPLHLLSDNFVRTHDLTDDTRFEICDVDARTLLHPHRLDLAAKLIYIESRESGADMTYAREVYAKHIEAFSEGNFSEPGDAGKTSVEDFFRVFDELIDDIREHGFDADKSLIPVGADDVILDGAHRTACAAYFGRTVRVIRFPDYRVRFDEAYFRERRLSEELLRDMAAAYTRYAVRPTYCACLWPVASEAKRPAAVGLIREKYPVLLDTTVSLEENGLRNFMLQIYQGQDWIGTPEDHFAGVMGKVDGCFAPGTPTEVVLFEGGRLEETLALKDSIRDIFRLGKHAIHISDSNAETALMASLLLNPHSRHALNYAKPDTFPAYYRTLKSADAGTVFGTGATLAFFGITDQLPPEEDGLVSPVNPRTYFSFDGKKLPALTEVKSRLADEGSPYLDGVNEILRKENPDGGAKRRLAYAKTRFVWKSKKVILRCKQIMQKAAVKLGVYKLINKLRGRG